MKQVILVAHGQLALEMKNSAEMIFGALPQFAAVAFCKEEGLEQIKEKIQGTVAADSREVLLFADLFCGTPYNAGCAVALADQERHYEVLSGMSLPLVLEAASMLAGAEIKEVADFIVAAAGETVKAFDLQGIEEEEEL